MEGKEGENPDRKGIGIDQTCRVAQSHLDIPQRCLRGIAGVANIGREGNEVATLCCACVSKDSDGNVNCSLAGFFFCCFISVRHYTAFTPVTTA